MTEKFGSRTKAANAISDGLVLVNGKRVNPSHEVDDASDITCIEPEEVFVSNGGYKLAKALKDFNFDVGGKIFADIGASNGGFTDCLFKNGAKKVYCIDVGESQLDKSLLDKNVVVIDNFNARSLSADLFKETLDGAVIDVSFISLTYILGSVANVLTEGSFVLALIKPQFECESRKVGKNGIVKEPSVHKSIIKKIYDFGNTCGLSARKLTNAPIIEGKNKEYLILFEKTNKPSQDINNLIKCVKL